MTRPQPRSKPKKTTTKPTAIDLFSGCGGLTLGLKQAGFHVIAGIELDELSTDTYKTNHPEVHVINADIRTINTTTFMTDLGLHAGTLDLLAGCPPCQGFSTIRTMKQTTAIDDPRNQLVHEFLRFASELLPKTIMLENVPGLTAYKGFTILTKKLQALGYTCNHAILDAAHYCVPQRRLRLVLLGSRYGTIPFAQHARKTITVKAAIGSLPHVGKSRDPLHDLHERRSARIDHIIASIPKDGGSRSALPKHLVLKCHQAFKGFRDVYGRMAWNDVAPTITGGCVNPSKGRFLHPKENRAITPREAALLQTFPKTYQFNFASGKYGVARQIGNAFPPEFARRHAAKIKTHLVTLAGTDADAGRP